MAEKKPDLSDLKARLGLTKPAASPSSDSSTKPEGSSKSKSPSTSSAPSTAAPGDSASESPAPRPGPSNQAPPGAPSAQPRTSGPGASRPPQAAGPPAQARPSQSPGPASSSAAPSAESSGSAQPDFSATPSAGRSRASAAPKEPKPQPRPVASVEIDDEGFNSSTFSAPILGLLAVCLVIGVVFGYAGSQTMYSNQVESARTADATALLEAFEPRIATFKEVDERIQNLKETEVDFETATSIANQDFAAQGNVLSNNRLLLGPVVIDNVTSYSADTSLLLAMLKEHERITTQVDREELEQLQQDNEVLENDHFGVIFDYRYVLQRGGDENFVPKPGQLVVNKGMSEEEEGKVSVEFLGSGRASDVELQGFVPLSKAQILRSGGGNAMTRYESRVRQLKFQSGKIEKYADNVLISLKNVADGDVSGAVAGAE